MNKQVTFGHILTILVMIIIPTLIWTKNVEVRFGNVIQNKKEINLNYRYIKDLEKEDDEIKDQIQKNQIEVIQGISDLKVLIEKNKP